MNSQAILSRREAEIAELVSWGGTVKDVSNRLYISPRTVETTIRTIYKKTGVTKVNELSAWFFCTHFNISFELSPLKRQLVAVLFLLLFVPSEFISNQIALRSMRRVEETRVARRGKEDYITIEV